jgi:hypothetical protein
LIALCLVLLSGCGKDGGEGKKASALLRSDDLGASWIAASGDQGLGFDTGCVAEAWSTGPPKTYDFGSYVNSAAPGSSGTPVTVEEYVIPMTAEAASERVSSFRASLPACTASLGGTQKEPEHLVSIPELPGVVMSTSTAGVPAGGIPGTGQQWTVLAPASGRGLVWLTISGGGKPEVIAIAKKAVLAAAASGS